MNQIPTEKHINVYDSLDERWAVKHFLGKSLDEAEALFRDNFLYYQEALMWMGPVAFAYYIKAAMRYLLSDESTGNADAASTFGNLIRFKIDYEPESLMPVKIEIRETMRKLHTEMDKFDCESFIYGNVAEKYKLIQEQLAD